MDYAIYAQFDLERNDAVALGQGTSKIMIRFFSFHVKFATETKPKESRCPSFLSKINQKWKRPDQSDRLRREKDRSYERNVAMLQL